MTYVTIMCDVTLHPLPKFKIKKLKLNKNKVKSNVYNSDTMLRSLTFFMIYFLLQFSS